MNPNPLNPTNAPRIDEKEEEYRKLRETVERCERLKSNQDFQWLWGAIFVPMVDAAMRKAQDDSLSPKEIKHALGKYNAMNAMLSYPGNHALDGRKAIDNYEKVMVQKLNPEARDPAEPHLKPGFQE